MPSIETLLMKRLRHAKIIYQSLLTVKKESFYNFKIEELLSSGSQSTFWRTLRSIYDANSNKNTASVISAETWVNHFEKLHSEHDINETQNTIINQLNTLESTTQSQHPVLDKAINDKELIKAMTKLENKKAPSNDQISNEMIKASFPILKVFITSCLIVFY